MTKIVDALVSMDGIVRMSAIRIKLVKSAGEEAGAALDDEVKEAGRRCETHGYLDDPAIFINTSATGKRIVVVCPLCSSPELLAQWEAQQQPGEPA